MRVPPVVASTNPLDTSSKKPLLLAAGTSVLPQNNASPRSFTREAFCAKSAGSEQMAPWATASDRLSGDIRSKVAVPRDLQVHRRLSTDITSEAELLSRDPDTKRNRSLSLHAHLTLPSLAPSRLIDRCPREIQKGATDRCAQSLAAKGHAFRRECLATPGLLARAEMDCSSGHPFFLVRSFVAPSLQPGVTRSCGDLRGLVSVNRWRNGIRCHVMALSETWHLPFRLSAALQKSKTTPCSALFQNSRGDAIDRYSRHRASSPPPERLLPTDP